MVWADPNDPLACLIDVDIEKLLIWTYRDQRADVVLGCDFTGEAATSSDVGAPKGIGRDSLLMAERIGALGIRVDGGGPANDDLDIDAEGVHACVTEKLDRPVALLVQKHARAASRPDDVAIVKPKLIRVENRLGNPLVQYEAWDKGRHYGHCLVEWTVPLGNAEVARLEYALWRRALIRLAAELNRPRSFTRPDGSLGKRYWLTRFRALPPAAPDISPRLPPASAR